MDKVGKQKSASILIMHHAVINRCAFFGYFSLNCDEENFHKIVVPVILTSQIIEALFYF